MTAFIALPLVADTQAVKSPLFTVWFVTSRIANTAGETAGGAISRRLTKLLTLTRRGGILKA